MRDITNPTGEPYEVTRKFLTRREEPKPFDRLGANADSLPNGGTVFHDYQRGVNIVVPLASYFESGA